MAWRMMARAQYKSRVSRTSRVLLKMPMSVAGTSRARWLVRDRENGAAEQLLTFSNGEILQSSSFKTMRTEAYAFKWPELRRSRQQ